MAEWLLRLWGKSRSSFGDAHPLLFHSLDCSLVVRHLWQKVMSAHSRLCLASFLGLSDADAERWIAFWVGLHDVGKASPTFQKKFTPLVSVLREEGFDFPQTGVGNAPHNVVTARVLPELLVDFWPDTNKDFRNGLATAVGAHHGTFPKSRDILELSADDIGTGRWDEARRALVEELAQLLKVDPMQRLRLNQEKQESHAFFIALAGLTSVADWIASSEKHFPYGPYEGGVVPVNQYMERAAVRASAALASLGWEHFNPPPQGLCFEKVFAITAPRPLQKTVMEMAQQLTEPALVIIEAPMGEGKTEATLHLGDSWMRDPNTEGFYAAMPTQATSNQMFGRVRSYLNRRFPNERINLHLLHANAALSPDYEGLRLAAIHAEDDWQATVVAEEWFTPKKRGLLAPVAVGTVDQALLSILQTRHLFVRLFGLAYKTVIIDEVHAYDTYMSTLLDRLLAWLAALKSPVVLLSATLPRQRRKELLQAYGGKALPEPKEKYPRVTTVKGGLCHVRSVEASVKSEVALRWVPASTGELSVMLKEALQSGGCAAMVCNTVSRAQDIFRALTNRFPREQLGLLHSRFPFSERDKRERHALQMFGKPDHNAVKRPHRFVMVGTQVLEQSLDVDFDLMVTDLAPADLVLQRMGRLHRHKQPARPHRLSRPTLWICEPDTDKNGLPQFVEGGHPYERYILVRSWLVLRNRLNIQVPGNVEEIVEAVYGEEIISESVPEAIKEDLESSRQRLEALLANQEHEARMRLIKKPTYPGKLWHMVESPLEEDSPELHEAHQALTRLAEPSVSVVCMHEINDVLYLGPEGAERVDLKKTPDLDQSRRLLKASLPLSHRGVVGQLMRTGVPHGWQKSALLRHHRPLVFKNREATVGQWTIDLHPDLGLVISKTERNLEEKA